MGWSIIAKRRYARFPPCRSQGEIIMANYQDYTDINKYSNRRSMDGRPLKENEILVPFWIQEGSRFSKGEILEGNCTTYHIAGCAFKICFIPIDAGSYAEYMRFFWKEINEHLKGIRNGRCVIGHAKNGDPVCCPGSSKCTGCPSSGKLPRFNPYKDKFQLVSLDLIMEESNFEVEDPRQANPEELICMMESPTEEEWLDILITRLEEQKSRYAQIVLLCRQNTPADEICRRLGLKSSRGYQEIINTRDACCDLLSLSCYKKKKKK